MYSPLKKNKGCSGHFLPSIKTRLPNVLYMGGKIKHYLHYAKIFKKKYAIFYKKQTHNALFSSKQHVNWKQKAKNKCQFIINMQFYSLHIYARRIVAIFSSACEQHALRTPMVL